MLFRGMIQWEGFQISLLRASASLRLRGIIRIDNSDWDPSPFELRLTAKPGPW